MSRFFVVSALHLRNRAAGSSARRHMTPPVCGGADCRTKYCGSALRTVCCRVGAAGSRGADCRTKYRGFALCTVCCRVGAAGSRGADCRTKYRGFALCTVCRRVGAAGSRGNCKPAVRVSAAIGFHREIGNGVSGVNIYLASPFFNETERKNHDAALAILREKGLEVSVASARQGKCFAENMGGSNVPGRCRRDPALRRTRASLLRAVFGQRFCMGVRLCIRARQKDRCGASARRKVELHGQLLLPRKRAGAGWTARVRFLCASADKLLRVKWAAGIRSAAYAWEGGSMCRALP